MWRRIRSGLSYLPFPRRILSECHHIPRGWPDCYYQALYAKRDNRPLDHWALLYGCTSWVRNIPLSCGWILQLPQRVGIAYLVCFACLFPIPYISCLHFLVYFQKKKKKKEKRKRKVFPFFISIRHELCYPFIYSPLMKLSSVLFRKSLHLSIYLLSYEYVCANCLMFPCLYSVL